MARKVPLPVKIPQDLLDEVDRCADLLGKRAGVVVDRTQFVEKALRQLCGQEIDYDLREKHRQSQEGQR